MEPSSCVHSSTFSNNKASSFISGTPADGTSASSRTSCTAYSPFDTVSFSFTALYRLLHEPQQPQDTTKMNRSDLLEIRTETLGHPRWQQNLIYPRWNDRNLKMGAARQYIRRSGLRWTQREGAKNRIDVPFTNRVIPANFVQVCLYTRGQRSDKPTSVVVKLQIIKSMTWMTTAKSFK